MIDVWKKEVKQDIEKLLAGKPTAQNAMLLAALIEIDEYLEEESEAEGSKPAARSVEPDEAESSYMEHIEDELEGAEEYYKMWLESKDPELKQMAKDELRHGEYFVKKARENGALTAAELRDVQAWHGSILAKLA